MGDSACLMQVQPFCYASGITNEANESNPIHALGQSISFGRFMSESLAWEKWSTFSHNRYVEEAERYSRPGSVAQKKAFFEAHYKKLAAQKAAAMLEQANNAAAQNNATDQEDASVIDNEVVVKGEQDAEVLSLNSESHPMVRATGHDASVIDNKVVVKGEQDAEVLSLNSESHPMVRATGHDASVIDNKVVVKGEQDAEVLSLNSESHPMVRATGHDASVIDNKVVVKGEQDAEVLSLTSESDPMVRATGHDDSDSNAEASIASERNKVEESETVMEQEAVVGNSMKVELQNHLPDVDAHKEQSEKLSVTPPIMTPTVKLLQQVIHSNYDQEVLPWTGKKKLSFSELLKANGISKFTSTPVKSTAPNGTSRFNSTPVKSTAPVSSKRDNIATPMSNKPAALSIAETKRSTPKSVNFTPIREFNRLTASVMRKFESARASAGSSKASKDSLMTPLQTPTMASKEMRKHSSLTPLTENKRNKTPIDPSVAGNHTSGPKWRMLYGENKMRSPIISSPFNLRTEERASRRKKKLEEKFNANEPQKVQLHTKLKEKAGTEIRKLSQSFCFKARPLPEFYKEMTASKNETTKNPLTHFESHKEGRKPIPSMAEIKTSLPPNRPALRNNSTKNFQGKSGRALTHHPLTSNSMKIIATHENTSPNIQHGNQNDRNYR